MGYTHYWYTPKEFSKKEFTAFSKDVKKILSYCHDKLGIHIANGLGEKKPTVNKDLIRFNGSDKQPIGVWTTEEDIIIPWPSPMASITEVSEKQDGKTEGEWIGGNLVSQRVAPVRDEKAEFASGSYETFSIQRIVEDCYSPNEKGLYFNCCKTAYRPYDLTVTAVLIAMKHHFPETEVKSDGDSKDWLDGKMLCFNLFGYGMDFEIR